MPRIRSESENDTDISENDVSIENSSDEEKSSSEEEESSEEESSSDEDDCSKSSCSEYLTTPPTSEDDDASSSSSDDTSSSEEEKKDASMKDGKTSVKKPPESVKKLGKLSGYILFCKDERSNVLKDHPEYKGGSVIKELGSRWRTSDASTKEKYNALAKEHNSKN